MYGQLATAVTSATIPGQASDAWAESAAANLRRLNTPHTIKQSSRTDEDKQRLQRWLGLLLTGLVVHLVLLHGWRRTPEEHLAAEVVEIGVHGEWDLQGLLGLVGMT